MERFLCRDQTKMMVKVWQEDKQEGLVDETILNAGDFMQYTITIYIINL